MGVTVAHTSCVSYRHAEMKEINDRQMSTTVRKIHMIPDMYEFRPSPTLLSREADKMDKYGRMVIIATKQQLDGKRSTLPVFAPSLSPTLVNSLLKPSSYRNG